MGPNSLKQHEGKILEFRFADGYAAIVKLIDVSAEHEDSDLVYEVLEVLDWGSIDPAKIDMKAAHAAASRDLLTARLCPEYRSSSRPPA